MRLMRKRNPSMKKKLSCSINITMERHNKSEKVKASVQTLIVVTGSNNIFQQSNILAISSKDGDGL